MENNFSHILFWKHPMETLAFFALLMSFVSLWVRRTPWLWGSFLVIATVLAFQSAVLKPIGLISIAALMLLHLLLRQNLKGMARFFLVIGVVALSIGLWAHVIPGFNNWKIASNLTLGTDAYPYSLWFNFDKPWTGIFILAWAIPLIQSKTQWKRVLKITAPLTLLTVVALMALSLKMKLVQFDPKLPTIIFLWVIDNLFFVSVPEEAFLRGFVQQEIFKWLGKGFWADIGCILSTALLFTLLHVKWVPSLPFLSLVFLAGVAYGTLYQWTKAIESSIFCHFSLNFVHFLFFTYPILKVG